MKIRFFCIACLSVVMFMSTVFAGEIDAPSAHGTTESFTLEDIWNRLNNGTLGSKDSFSEPGSGPGPTGKTLNDVMGEAPSKDDTAGAVPADVKSGKTFWGLNTTTVPSSWGNQTGKASLIRKTGQTKCYDGQDPPVAVTCPAGPPGQDGYYQAGDELPLPSERFTDNLNGTVTDNLTGLIWLKKANCGSNKNWATALDYVKELFDGCTNCFGGTDDCSLNDGSVKGVWRLPNRFELESLLDLGNFNPAIPSGHPFISVQNSTYWSSTTPSGATTNAFNVNMGSGSGGSSGKTSGLYIWPVRGGQTLTIP